MDVYFTQIKSERKLRVTGEFREKKNPRDKETGIHKGKFKVRSAQILADGF